MDTKNHGRTIAEDIGQTRPFRSKGHEALVALIRTAGEVERVTGDALSPFGITSQQYNVLRILRGAGDEGLPTLTIGERMLTRTPGVTRLIDRIETRGWAQRRRCDKDRRRVYCTISKAGLELLAVTDPLVEKIDSLAMSGLSDKEMDVFLEILATIRATSAHGEAG
jgi:DNA-binding MarR family transcriptional regulator